MNSRAFGQLLVLGALWGAAFMFMRIAAPEFGAVGLAGARVVLACVAMLAIVYALRESMRFATHWKKYAVVGAINTAVPFAAYCFAALHIPSGYSAIANSTTPIWGALIASFWFKDKLGAAKWFGVVFAFAGVIALVGLKPVGVTPLVVAGMVACLLAASMYATASFLIKRYLSDIPGIVGATGMVWGATLWLVLPSLFAAPAALPSGKAWFALAFLALGCTAAAYVLFFHLIKTIGPQRASSVAFLFPAFAAFWGWLFLDEPITANMLLGMALVLVGTALVSAPADGLARLRGSARTFAEQLALPMLIGILPSVLRRPLLRAAIGWRWLFRAEAEASVASMLRYLPEVAPAKFAERYRLNRLTDLSDFWISWFRRAPHHVPVVQIDPALEINPRALWVTFHHGAGWWITSYFHRKSLTANLLIRRPTVSGNLIQRLCLRIGIFRNERFAKWVRAPLIWSNESSAALKMRAAWRSGVSVIALSDLPAAATDRAETVRFFGRSARVPSAVFSIAHAARVPVYLFLGGWNEASLRPELRIEMLADIGVPAEEAIARYISRLEREIRANPGAWHVWPSIESYFDSTAESSQPQ